MSNWHEMDKKDLLAELGADAITGLRSDALEGLRAKYGYNRFDEQKTEGIGKKILHNLRDVSTIILIFAAILSLAMELYQGEGLVEFIVIIGIVILNMALAISQEMSAEKSLAVLQGLSGPSAMALRDSQRQEIDSAELLPGDIIFVKTGDMVPADARLLESSDLAVDESALTGESEPAEKDAGAVISGRVAVGDQNNMIFSGGLVAAGHGTAVVTAIGMNTQVGGIAGYLGNTQKLKTPLQCRLDKIAKTVSLIAVVSAVLMFSMGYLRGDDFWEMVFVAISLAVAAVPETLALIVTVTLSRGVAIMARHNALIRKLQAVETLGGTSIICTDKTGTLTQNRMTITRLWDGHGEPVSTDGRLTDSQNNLLELFALCCNAVVERGPDGERIIGDPTESAILRLLHNTGGNKEELAASRPRVAEISFSSARKMMTTVHRDGGSYLVLTKGAFDRVPFAPAGMEELWARNAVHDACGHDALRVIAIGSKRVNELPPDDRLEELESGLRFEGIVGIIDPPRPECAQAIATARSAGIRTVMITGDHAATAGAIARQIGLMGDGGKVATGLELAEMSDDELIRSVPLYSVYARVSPDDKIRIVEAWQEHGEVVAMTGDGVNDAPALKAADVGTAMGIAGTDVAKSAADMILLDDNFSTIVEAVRRGRDVFSNIRKAVYFLLVCNFSEIIIMLGAAMIGWGLPLSPIMLLLINVLGDGIPGIQLAYETSDPRIMLRRPIGRDESLFHGLRFVIGVQIAAFVAVAWVGYYFGAFVRIDPALRPSHAIGQTLTFLIVGWTSILHVFTVRSRASVFRRTLRDNPRIVAGAAAMVAFFAMLVAFEPLGAVFGMTPIGKAHWILAASVSLLPTAVAEIGKLVQNRAESSSHTQRLIRHTARTDI